MQWIHSETQTSEFYMTSSRWRNLKAEVQSTWDVLVNLGAIGQFAKMIISECAEGKQITGVIMYDPVQKRCKTYSDWWKTRWR